MSSPIRCIPSFVFALLSTVAIAQTAPAAPPDPATLPGAAPVASSPGNVKSRPSQPSVVVVLDSSSGHSNHFAQMRDAAMRFINALGDERDVAVVAAGDKPTVVADFNTDPDKVFKQIRKIKPRGAPALQSALALATQRAATESDSAAVVVFARNPEPGLVPANPAPAASSPVPVYVIASPDSKWNVQAQMQQLAVKSGGTAFFPSNDRELRDVVKETATRVAGHPDFDGRRDADKNLLRGYERLIVRDIPVEESPATNEAGGGENLLMQQVLVARIRKAKLFPVVVNGADQHALESASSAPIGNALELRATILEFRRGNKVQRQFLIGVKGGAKMKLRVILVDTSTNQAVLAFTKEATYASGLWGGSPEHVQAQAMLNVANEIVNELKRAR